MEQKSAQGCLLEFALQTILQIAHILKQMHKKGVMHRSINPGCIYMKASSNSPSGFKVASIGAFDTAYYLQKRRMIKQRFLIEGFLMAPEIEAG